MKKPPTIEDIADRSVVWDIGRRDEIADLGFRVEGTDGSFSAHELSGNRRVPAEGEVIDLDTLLVRVREEVQRTGISESARLGSDTVAVPTEPVNFQSIDDIDPDEVTESTLEDDLESPAVETIDTEADGQRLLPGQEKKVCQPLTTAALAYHAAKNDRVAATAKETATRDQLKMMAGKYEEHFTPDPNNSDSKIYVAGTTGDGRKIIVRDQKKVDEKITTEETE